LQQGDNIVKRKSSLGHVATPVQIAAGPRTLEGDLAVPDGIRGTFDIGHLARRPEMRDMRVAYFVASTGRGAAQVAVAERPEAVGAVVSRDGRPDLAGEVALARVRSPTFLIVRDADSPVIALNRQAMAERRSSTRRPPAVTRRGSTMLKDVIEQVREDAARITDPKAEAHLVTGLE
jgi:hypothetical protein